MDSKNGKNSYYAPRLFTLAILFAFVGLLMASVGSQSASGASAVLPDRAGPNLTPTPCCDVVTATMQSSCLSYGYSYTLNNTCSETVRANGCMCFEVAPTKNGPWTTAAHIDYLGRPINPGQTSEGGVLWFGPLPTGNYWWRNTIYLLGCNFYIRESSAACSVGTGTPVATNTPSAPTDTPQATSSVNITNTSSATPTPTARATATATLPPPSPTATPACRPAWGIVPLPGTSGNYLYGVTVVSSDDLWVVGGYQDAIGDLSRTLIEHWDGSRWSVAPSIDPGSDQNSLYDVKAVSANDVWAVGYYGTRVNVHPQTLVEHWDGTRWSLVPSPSPDISGGSFLSAVAAVSANDVWAVGYYYNINPYYQTLVEHWDGTQWSIVPSPNPGVINFVTGVAAVSANDVWAVGYYGLGSNIQTLIEHWDGTQWSVVSSPNLGGGYNYLKGVVAVSANDVWAVGYYNLGDSRQTLIEHWDGKQWSVVASPNPGAGYNYLQRVAAVSANDVWAVGHYMIGAINRILIEHWDGNQWNIVSGPNPSANLNYLTDVAVVSANDVWAVGVYNTHLDQAVVERYTDFPFTDVHSADYFYTAVRYLYCHGAVSGYSDNTFRPYNYTTRAQLCKIIVLAEGWQVECPTVGHFSDVQPGNVFFCYVETAYSQGIVAGYADGTFRPGNNVTRAQLCKIIVLAEGWTNNCPTPGHFSDVPPSDPFFCFIETASHRGIISGYADGTFRPGNSATRGQICKIVYRAVTQP